MKNKTFHKQEQKGSESVGITWQMLDVGGQQFGFLLLITLLRDVT